MLLGRHVSRCADAVNHGALGHGDRRRAEIGDLDVGIVLDQDVGWLDVAMDHADLGSKIQGTRTFVNDFDDIANGQQIVRPGKPLQCAAGNILHDDIGIFLVSHGIIDLDNMRMIQLARQ